MTSHTATVNAEQAARLEAIVRDRGYRLRDVPYARFSGVKPDHNVTCYESGKVVIQGKGTREFVEFVLEPEVLQTAVLGYETVLNPELLDPRLGVDESGSSASAWLCSGDQTRSPRTADKTSISSMSNDDS